MLDRALVAQKITKITPFLFSEHAALSFITKDFWKYLVGCPGFKEQVQSQQREKRLATWTGELSDIMSSSQAPSSYTVCAVDGSQIYPDHHLSGAECCLVNAAGCCLHYGSPSSATFFSEPHIYVPAQCEAQQLAYAADTVDLLREEHEFDLLAHSVRERVGGSCGSTSMVALFDGNLLFWHLEEKSAAVRKRFLGRYCASLQELFQHQIPIAGYLSMPRFRDLAYIVQVGMTAPDVACLLPHELLHVVQQKIAVLTDRELLAFVLDTGERTTIFQSTNMVTELYPAPLRPCFLYFNSGSEIVRIEVPAWVAQDYTLVDRVCAVCSDQCVKGNGYPVALAEAHAQAVVKSVDRDFFYNYIYKIAVTHRQRVVVSQKSLKKRVLGV
jgi:hypothetical protein